jgi:hypothetical protein
MTDTIAMMTASIQEETITPIIPTPTSDQDHRGHIATLTHGRGAHNQHQDRTLMSQEVTIASVTWKGANCVLIQSRQV